MNEKLKNTLWTVFAVAMVVVGAVLFLSSDLEHIEDTNGPDDISLTTITDENIINLDMGAITPVKVSELSLNVGGWEVSNGVKFSSDRFTGVHEVFYNNYIGASDVELELSHLTVDSGNFKMVVLLNDEIVATIEPSEEPIYFRMDDINGYFSVRIAGESASYSFAMSAIDYDMFVHD